MINFSKYALVPLTSLVLNLLMGMQTNATSNIKLKFDPAVEGGSPSIFVQYNKTEDTSSGYVLLTSYVLEDTVELFLASKEVYPGDTVFFELPNRGKEDVLGIRVELISKETAQQNLLSEWRTLYLPGKKLINYKGSKQLKRPRDFARYWEEAKKELAKIPISAELKLIPERTTATGKLYRVKLNSYGNVPIIGWYYVPKEVDPLAMDTESASQPIKKYPAIQIMPGWGAEEPPIDRTKDGFITLSLNPRHHGPSKEFFTTPVDHHLYNIDKPKEYYYRMAYMDCLRGIDFLLSRPEVDTSRIAVEGGSQGGAFAFAVAALYSDKIACAVSNVTYISNFPDYIRIATSGSARSFAKYWNDEEKGEIVRRTLAYIDVANLASWVKCPTMVCVGLQDKVCPPVNGIVALNRIPKGVPRELVLDPDAGHEITPLMREANMRWLKKYLQK